MPSKVHWTIQQFLDGYPDQGDDTSLSINLLFYSDRLRCQPDNLKITEIHQQYLLYSSASRFQTLINTTSQVVRTLQDAGKQARFHSVVVRSGLSS